MRTDTTMRLAMLAIAIQEIARALASAQAAAVADALSARVATMSAGALAEVQDEAAMGELVPLLSALGRPGPMSRSHRRPPPSPSRRPGHGRQRDCGLQR